MVRASDSQFSSPGFEFRSGHLLDLFLVVSSSSPRPRLQIANWLPTACYVVYALFVSELFKAARYSFSRSLRPKFERKLRRHKQGFGKIDTTVVLDKEENWL